MLPRIAQWEIRQTKTQLSQLRKTLSDYNKKYPNLIIHTSDLFGYGAYTFEIMCSQNLLKAIKIEAVYSPMDRKWKFFYKETGGKLEKPLGWFIRKFAQGCKKEKRW